LPDGSKAIELKNSGVPFIPVPFIPPVVDVKAPVVGLMVYVKTLPKSISHTFPELAT
jgi:hypothetical protein